MRDNICYALAAAIAVATITYFVILDRDCDKKNGRVMRSLWGSYECVVVK